MARTSKRIEDLHLVEIEEYGAFFKTGTPVCFRFARNTQKSPNFGSRFQQDIEPAGRYMISIPLDQPLHGSDWASGSQCFQNPLVLRFTTDPDVLYGPGSWKARLQSHFGKKGKTLSRHLLKLGYDGIVTVWVQAHSKKGDSPSHVKEIVDLTPAGARKENPAHVSVEDIDVEGIVDALAEVAVEKAKGKTPESLDGVFIGGIDLETLDIAGRRTMVRVQAWFEHHPRSERLAHHADAGDYAKGFAINLYLNSALGGRLRVQHRLGYLQQEMRSVLVHELVHIRTLRSIGHRQKYKFQHAPAPSWFKGYYNDTVEMPAYTAQVVSEAKHEADLLRSRYGGREIIDRALAGSYTWQTIEPHLTEKNKRRIMSAVARELTKENPVIRLPTHRIRELAKELTAYIAKHVRGTEPLGYGSVLGEAPFDIVDASGEEQTVYIRIMSKPTRSPYYVREGATGHDSTGRVFVVIFLNGSVPADDIRKSATGAPSSFADQVYTVLVHEMTHAAEPMRYLAGESKKPPQGDDPDAYYNDPHEVRAFMQEVVQEALERKRVLPKLTKAYGVTKGFGYLLKMCPAWQDVSPHWTDKNQRKVILAVVKALQDSEE